MFTHGLLLKGFAQRIRNSLHISRSFFHKLLFSYLIIVLIPTVVISSVYLFNYSNELKDQIETNSRDNIHNFTGTIGMVLSNIDNFSLQMSFMPELDNILRNPDGAGIYQYNDLKEYMKSQISANDLFYSVYLYMKLNDKVLTTGEGMFNRADFYDSALIDDIVGNVNKAGGYKLRTIQDSNSTNSTKPTEVLTFSRPVPIVNSSPLGYLVVNIKKDVLIDMVNQLEGDKEQNMAVVHQNGEVIYNNNLQFENSVLTDYLSDHPFKGEDGLVTATIGKQKYMLSYSQIGLNDWMAVQLLPYSTYQSKWSDKLTGTLQISVGIILIGLLLSYLFAIMMYKPWKRILADLSLHLKSGGKTVRRDEYSLINEAINRIVDEHANAKQVVEQYEPVIRDRFIYDLLNNYIADKAALDSRMHNLNVRLSRGHYTVLVVSSDLGDGLDTEEENKRLLIFQLIGDVLRQYVDAEGTLLDNGRFAFVISLTESGWNEVLMDSFKRHCREINEAVQERLQVAMQFSFGDIYPGLDKISDAYAQAKRMLNYKAVINKSDIVFSHRLKQDHKLEYPLAIQKQLIHGMMSVDKTQVNGAVDQLFDQYIYDDSYPREKVQELIVLLMSTVKSALLQEGYEPAALNDNHHILKMSECQNYHELKACIISDVHGMMEVLDSAQDKKNSNLYIANAIQYMEKHYSSNISISDIAEHIGLSSGYLSKIFKSEIGKTPLEYLTEYRIRKSKELLRDNQSSLQQISERIGYNDVHSFIRFFKKYERITPGEYRKHLT